MIVIGEEAVDTEIEIVVAVEKEVEKLRWKI